jgi:CubicO group peptidase (beta-lactamase class C family)
MNATFVRSFLTYCCFSLFLQSHSARAQSTLGARIDSLFTVYRDSGFTGSVLVAEKGTVTLKKGYGFADAEKKT